MLEPVQDITESSGTDDRGGDIGGEDSLLSRLFGVRRGDGTPAHPPGADLGPMGLDRTRSVEGLREEVGDRVNSGFRDLSRLLAAIKDTLQNRDGQVQPDAPGPAHLPAAGPAHPARADRLLGTDQQAARAHGDGHARRAGSPRERARPAAHAGRAPGLPGAVPRPGPAAHRRCARAAVHGHPRRARDESSSSGGAVGDDRSIASTQEDVFSTFQNTQNRALNVFHRAQTQANAQHRETQRVLSSQVEMLVEKVHTAQVARLLAVDWLRAGRGGRSRRGARVRRVAASAPAGEPRSASRRARRRTSRLRTPGSSRRGPPGGPGSTRSPGRRRRRCRARRLRTSCR